MVAKNIQERRPKSSAEGNAIRSAASEREAAKGIVSAYVRKEETPRRPPEPRTSRLGGLAFWHETPTCSDS